MREQYMPLQKINNGRTGKHAHTSTVVVERATLSRKTKKQAEPPEEEKITGLFVNGDSKRDTDDETLIIPLSRRTSHGEQTLIKNAIEKECRKFVKTAHFRGPSIRIRINHTSGETLCERQVHECVKEAVRSL